MNRKILPFVLCACVTEGPVQLPTSHISQVEEVVGVPDISFLSIPFQAEKETPWRMECVHELGTHPKLTTRKQKETQALIRFVSSKLGMQHNAQQLLLLVAERESSFQAGVIHQLPQDLDASKSAFNYTKPIYPNNPWRRMPEIWQTYGLFGMNSNYFTQVWDKKADPRVFCDPIVDILVYRRSLERMRKRFESSPVICKNEQGEPQKVRVSPTWENLHRAVSGGKLCPGNSSGFRARAQRRGLNPEEIVKATSLGKEPLQPQENLVREYWTEFKKKLLK